MWLCHMTDRGRSTGLPRRRRSREGRAAGCPGTGAPWHPPISVVLFVSYSGVRGGGERLLLDALAGAGPRAVLACPDGPLAQDARAAGVPVLLLPERELLARRLPLRALARLVAHSREITAAGARRWIPRPSSAGATARRSRSRWRDPVPSASTCTTTCRRARGVGRVLRAAARRADRVVASSATLAAALGVEADGDPSGSRHRGVRPARGAGARPADAARPRRDRAVEGDRRRRRGRRPAARRAPRGRRRGARRGRRGACSPRLRERAAEPDLAGRVEFTGGLADPRAALHGAHALLHPAERESFGIAVAEAMACGLPVAVADAGALPELTDPSCATTFPPGDADAAARSGPRGARPPRARRRRP